MRPVEAGRAVVLLSGGVDSATLLAVAKQRGFLPYCLTFIYGQRHRVEVEAARAVASIARAREHFVIRLALQKLCASPLLANGELRSAGPGDAISPAYVPARNTIFLAIALAWSESIDACDIFIGANREDQVGFPDCRPEFFRQFNRVALLGTTGQIDGRPRIRIHAPFATLSKSEVIAEGLRLGVDYSLTVSCYNPGRRGISCGVCDACSLRLKAFSSLGLRDPARYRKKKEKGGAP